MRKTAYLKTHFKHLVLHITRLVQFPNSMIHWEHKIRIIRGPLYLRIFDCNILSKQKIYILYKLFLTSKRQNYKFTKSQI